MTNIKKQKILDKKKYIESEKCGCDKSGGMDYCQCCDFRLEYNILNGNGQNAPQTICTATQLDREMNCLCAKAYNRLHK